MTAAARTLPFSTPGDGAGTIGAWGNVGRGFAHPVDVALDPETGRILVLNRSTSWKAPHGRAVRVSVLDGPHQGADVIAEFARLGTDPGELMAPVAIATDGHGRVAITDEHTHTLSVFSADGEFVRRVGGPGDGPGRFRHPAGVTADVDGMWVVDAANDRIQRLTWEGEPIAVVGASGLGAGDLRHPWLLSRDADGHLWVADWGNDRVVSFAPDGRCVAVVGSSGGAPFHRPNAIVCGPDGARYVGDWGRQRLLVFDAAWRRIDIWYGDADLSPWAQDRLDEFPRMAAGREAAGDPAGERQLGRPGGLCILPGGDVLVADTSHHRLQIYRPAPPSLVANR